MANEKESSANDQGKRTMAGSMRGIEYQAMLALSALIKAGVLMRQDDEFQCTIASEDATAGKFDDAIFRCMYRGVLHILNIQAKNRMSAPPVQWSELFGQGKKDFSLVTYFESFCKLKSYHAYNLERHQLVLCTNSDLSEEVKHVVEKVNLPEAIDIFSPLGAYCYRFTFSKLIAAGKYDSIKSLLSNSTESYRLANLLANAIFSGTELDLNVNNSERAKLLYTYKQPLRELVGECRENNMHEVRDNFITGLGLSAEDALFRKDFEAAYTTVSGGLVDIWNDVKTKGIKVKVSKQGKEGKQTSTTAPQCANLPNDAVTDEDIATFFRLFVIVAKADELPAKITTLLAKANVFDLSATQLGLGEMDIAYKYAYSMIYDWMKQQSDLPSEIEAPHVRSLLQKIGLRLQYQELKNLGSDYLASLKDKQLSASQERLRTLPLYEFLHAPDSTDHRSPNAFTFYSPYSPELAAWIVLATMQLDREDKHSVLEICFIDTTKDRGDRTVKDILCRVDLSLVAIITCADKPAAEQLEREINETIASLGTTSRLASKKLVLVAQITGKEAKSTGVENSLRMEHLTQEAFGRIVPRYAELNMFGTEILLKDLMRADDDVAILLHFRDRFKRSMLQQSLTERHYQRILPWYIQREFEIQQTPNTQTSSENSAKMGQIGVILPDENDKPKLSWDEFALTFAFVPFDVSDFENFIRQEATQQRVTLSPLPGCEERADGGTSGKVHIILEEAGFGKSTYLSWLGGHFQCANRSLWVIRFNSIDYSTDFKRLSDGDRRRPLNDTEAVRFLYQMAYLALFVTNIHRQEIKETDRERRLAEQGASLLSFSQDNQRLTVDEEKWKRMQWSPVQLLMARFFVTQFNSRALVILFDGFDEVVPYYTDVVCDLLSRFQSFDGIRTIYITSRPHRLREEFGAMFKNPIFYQLKPFSDADIARVVHIFMSREFEAYQSDREVGDLLCSLSGTIKFFLGSFSKVPLYISMALDVLKPLIEENVDFADRTVNGKIIDVLDSTFEPLTLMETLFENKVLKANVEKVQLTDSASHIAGAISNMQKLKKHALHIHSVLALYVFFDASERARLLLNDGQAIEYMEEVRVGDEKSGIIEGIVGDRPIFIHRTFAEYFAALWLCRNRTYEHVRSFLRTFSFWGDHRKEMREFFDRILLNEPDSTAKNLFGYQLKDIKELLRQEPELLRVKDAGGRNILHLLVLHSTADELASNDLSPYCDINAKDVILQWSALDYAVARRSERDISHLLQLGADIETLQLIDVILNHDAETILRKTLEYERFLQRIKHPLTHTNQVFAGLVSELHARVVPYLMADRQLDLHRSLLEQGGDKLTPLQYCVVNNQAPMVRAMVEHGGGFGQVLARCVDPLLVQAFDSTAVDVVKFLIVDCQCVVPAAVGDDALVNVLDKSISLRYNELFQVLTECFCKRKSFNYTEYSESDTEEDVNKFYEAICFTYNVIDREEVVDPAVIDTQILRLLRCAFKSTNLYAAKTLVQLAALDIDDLTYPLIVEGMRECKLKPMQVHWKCESAVLLLIEATKRPHATDDEGRTFLHIALANNCFHVAQHLIEQKEVKLLQTDEKNRWNAFHYCLMEQSTIEKAWTKIDFEIRTRKEFFERMMELEPCDCVTAKDALGRNALHLAIMNRHCEQALLILKYNTETVAPHERWSRSEALLAEAGVVGTPQYEHFMRSYGWTLKQAE